MGVRPARRHLVIFARRPQLGVGKRRLAANIGNVAAVRFQRHALNAVLLRLWSPRLWRLWIAVSPDYPTGWVRRGAAIGQGGGSLGDKLARMTRSLPNGPIVIVGSDTPQVSADDVRSAFRRITSSGAVFGPAVDGGYWLIGLSPAARRRPPFKAVRWSTPHALADTAANLGSGGYTLLRKLEDVDDGESLARTSLRISRMSP